jgi:hypothetical protein
MHSSPIVAGPDADGHAPVYAADQRVSKKVKFQAHAVSLYFMHYNLARPHQTLTRRSGRKTTPPMAAGVEDHVWSVREIAGLLD